MNDFTQKVRDELNVLRQANAKLTTYCGQLETEIGDLEKGCGQLKAQLKQALKLNALPSGLSAGQSVQLEKKLAFYIEACAAHQRHIDELQADARQGMVPVEKVRLLVEALEYAGCHEHECDTPGNPPCSVCERIDAALLIANELRISTASSKSQP